MSCRNEEIKSIDREFGALFLASDIISDEYQARIDEIRGNAAVPDLSARRILSTESWERCLGQSMECLNSRKGVGQGHSIGECLTKDRIAEIEKRLAAELHARAVWDRWDYLMVFGTSLSAVSIDLFFNTSKYGFDSMMRDKGSRLRRFCDNIHGKHGQCDPIDWRGERSGDPRGGNKYHRQLSSGHDILRFFTQGIVQMMRGEFNGLQKNGNGWEKVHAYMDSGEMSFAQAFVRLSIHLFCDFFSYYSLPVPGSTLIMDYCRSEKIRDMIYKSYQQGLNMRKVTLQSMAPAINSLFPWLYWKIRYAHSGEGDFALGQKLLEMRTLAHTFTTMINAGKVVITKNPVDINIPQLIATMKSIYALVRVSLADNELARLERNTAVIEQNHLEISRLIGTVGTGVSH